jgi:hypothetical protein
LFEGTVQEGIGKANSKDVSQSRESIKLPRFKSGIYQTEVQGDAAVVISSI